MNPIRASLIMSSLAAVGVAQAQTATTAPAAPTPVVVTKSDAGNSLTWNGITLYGIVDIGLQYQTHGVPISDYFPAGSEAIISKNSNGSITGLTPSNLSQSRIGLSGLEPIGNDFSFVFRLETFFNPQSGNLSDGLKSITLNNGRPLDAQTTTVDSSVAGQLFAGAAYAGFTHARGGSLTFGRHVTLLADGISKYDPMGAAQAFSVIGFSGTAAGGGDTENRRLDDSVKYSGRFGPVHVGALYQFNGASGSAQHRLPGSARLRTRWWLARWLLRQEEGRNRRGPDVCGAGRDPDISILDQRLGRLDDLGQHHLLGDGPVQLRGPEDLRRLRAHQV